MLSDPERSALLDMLHNIALAEEFTRDQTFESFRDDFMRLYAVTRCLEIISEAPEYSWRQVAGAGNIYRHDYEDVAARRLWDTVQVDPPRLRAIVEKELGPN
jgi:uncharacterized protein with HEPN domain